MVATAQRAPGALRLAACVAQLCRPDAAVDAVRTRVLAAPLAMDRSGGNRGYRCRTVAAAPNGRLVSRCLRSVAWGLGRGGVCDVPARRRSGGSAVAAADRQAGL